MLAAESRSNAGVDHIATVRKLALFAEPGERVMALLAAGNLATDRLPAPAWVASGDAPDD